mmetsp:Transcript_36857/g.102282  ORF Transcript_36857/g.102282 Transcript_36857/m.102282 type:complete len:209 (-) Transcript_36857:133-759(-)
MVASLSLKSAPKYLPTLTVVISVGNSGLTLMDATAAFTWSPLSAVLAGLASTGSMAAPWVQTSESSRSARKGRKSAVESLRGTFPPFHLVTVLPMLRFIFAKSPSSPSVLADAHSKIFPTLLPSIAQARASIRMACSRLVVLSSSSDAIIAVTWPAPSHTDALPGAKSRAPKTWCCASYSAMNGSSLLLSIPFLCRNPFSYFFLASSR